MSKIRVLVILASSIATASLAQVNSTPAAGTRSEDAGGFQRALILAPNLSWTTGTQRQTIFGGSALLSSVHSKSYCDPKLTQFGFAASASDTTTTKVGGTPTYLDNNNVRLDATRGVFGAKNTRSYLGADADFFENNSLGVGLQQIYAAKYQYYFAPCSEEPQERRWFASVGIGAGFLRQRLYSTASPLNTAALPVTAQVSYLQGLTKGKAPKLMWYALLGYMPSLTETHAYQLSAVAGVQIPTSISWLKISLSDSDLYMENAPSGHRRNYQNGTVSLVLSLPRAKDSGGKSVTGACYGGDKLQRLYCYDKVTSDACAPPNMFRPNSVCSSAGPTTIE